MKICHKKNICPRCQKIEICNSIHFGKHQNELCLDCVNEAFRYCEQHHLILQDKDNVFKTFKNGSK